MSQLSCQRVAPHRRSATVISAVLSILLLGTGCESLTDQSGWRWTMTGSVNPVNWTSGQASGLTELSVDCPSTAGNNPHALLAGLAGFKDFRTADRFIERLDVDCIPYGEFGGRYTQFAGIAGGVQTVRLTTSTTFQIGNGEVPLRLEGRQVPIGIVVYHNNKNYVQNLHIIWGEEENGIITDYLNWYDYDPDDARFTFPTISDWPNIRTLRLAGAPFPVSRSRELICPSQNVITGMRITQSSNGKIRSLGIDCRLLTNN